MSTSTRAAATGFDLEGRVAWVTGAGRGLGRAAAKGLAAAGVRVALTSRSAEDLENVSEEIGPDQALVLPGSVSNSGQMTRAASDVVNKWGTLDILVNMAGINPSVVDSDRVSDKDWQDVLDVNLTGTFYCCRAVAPVMLAAGSGSIINVSSIHASVGVPRMPAYAATKGGVEALTRALAVEWAASEIRVNCLAPGYFLTPLTNRYLESRNKGAVLSSIPMGRVGDPPEIMGAVLFLASSQSSYVTGSTLTIDGGWTAQ